MSTFVAGMSSGDDDKTGEGTGSGYGHVSWPACAKREGPASARQREISANRFMGPPGVPFRSRTCLTGDQMSETATVSARHAQGRAKGEGDYRDTNGFPHVSFAVDESRSFPHPGDFSCRWLDGQRHGEAGDG